MKRALLTIFVFLFTSSMLFGQRYTTDVSIDLTISTTQNAITISWPFDINASGYHIYKRPMGTSGWGAPISTQNGNGISYTDNSVTADSIYEYSVRKWVSTHSDTAYAYVTSGIEIAPQHYLGTMLLLVEQTYYGQFFNEVETLQRDLIGSGYNVKTKLINQSAPVDTVTNYIRGQYMQYGTDLESVFLLGHIPVPYSGDIVPDGHTNNHQGAWAADGFYGEVTSTIDPTSTSLNVWSDISYSNNWFNMPTRTENRRGDGKFDNNTFPSTVELQVGRVDFTDIPSFQETEAQLIKSYLQKNHDYRHGKFSVQKRAFIDDNFGYFSGEAFASNAYRSFPVLVGPSNVDTGNFSTSLVSNDYLYSYGCGAGTYNSAAGITNTPQLVNDSIQSVFSFLFGSYFGDYDSQNNLLRAHLARGTVLATAWAGRPKWLIHPMALGKSIGYCTRLTQNATDYDMNSPYNPSSGTNEKRSVHIALMGDPSLKADVTLPVSNLTVSLSGTNDAQLTWTAPTGGNITGYYIYRKFHTDEKYELVNDQPITSTNYLDECLLQQGDYHYMVRSSELITGASGTYYNLSQGMFDTLNNPNSVIVVPGFSLTTSSDTIYINNLSTATNMSWDFDNGQTSTSTSPGFATYAQNGTYDITQIVSKGCYSDTLVKSIDVKGIYKLPPRNLQVTELPGGHAKLVWNKPLDLTEGYAIDRYYKSTGFKEKIQAALYDTTFVDSCLAFDDKYEYRVSSFRRDTFSNGWRTNYTPPMPGNSSVNDSFALSQDYTLKAGFLTSENKLDVTLTDDSRSADDYWWDMGDGSKYFVQNPPTHSYFGDGEYTITQAVERYCPQGMAIKRVDTTRKVVKVSKSDVSINEISNVDEIRILPNPFHNNFTIHYDADNQIKNITLFTTTGQKIQAIESSLPTSTSTSFETGNLPPGSYLLQITYRDGKQRSLPLIKQ